MVEGKSRSIKGAFSVVASGLNRGGRWTGSPPEIRRLKQSRCVHQSTSRRLPSKGVRRRGDKNEVQSDALQAPQVFYMQTIANLLEAKTMERLACSV